MESSHVGDFLISLLYSLPFLLIYFIGFILSFVCRGRLGRLWLFPVFAFFLHLLATLIHVGHQAFYFLYIVPSGNYSLYVPVPRIVSIIAIGLHIIGYALLYVALFGRRNAEPNAVL